MTEHLHGASTPPPPAYDLRRARRVLALVSFAAFAASLDLFIVNVAFPDIARDFDGASLSSLSWVLSAYAIVFAALLVPAGRLADRLGRRRGFLTGLGLFTGASALCALAGSVEVLVGARVLQAAGGALLLPSALGLLLPEFPPERRHSAIAIFTATGALAAGLGPVIGGLLVEVDWRLVFLVNLPVGLVTGVLAARTLRESRDPDATVPDVAGAVVLGSGIAALALGIVQGPGWGWTDARVLGAFAAAVLAVAVVLRRSGSHPSPVLELEVLRVRSFAVANLALGLFSVAFASFLLGMVLFLTGPWDMGVLEAGLAITPGPLMATLTAPAAGVLADRLGPRRLAVPGAALFAAGTASWIVLVGETPSYAGELLPGMLLTGLGVGLTLPTLSSAGAAALPPQRFATGNAVVMMSRQLGAALGVAVLTAILAAGDPTDVLGGYQAGWALSTGTALAASLAALALGRVQVGAPVPTAARVTGEAVAANA